MATTTPEEAIAGALRRPRRPLISKRRHRQIVLTYLFLIPASAIFILYRLVPLGWNFLLSFQFWSPTAPAEFAGLYHYEEMFLFDNVFREALKNTMIYMLTAPIGIVIALGLALLVNAEIKNRGLYRTLIFLSYPLMTVGVGIIWRWLYDEKVGLFNFVLRSLGIIDKPIAFLESFSTALASIMAAAVWQILGFFMIILLTGLQNIPNHLYEAASIDGANKFRQFYRITLPLLRPSIFLCLIIGIIASFTSFDLIFVMTNGGPGHATELLITYIYRSAFQLTMFDYAGALTVVMFVFFVSIAFLANILAGGDAGKVDISE